MKSLLRIDKLRYEEISVEELKVLDSSATTCCTPATAEEACCEPNTGEASCCGPDEDEACCPQVVTKNKSLNLLQSIAIPAGLLGGFLLSDYWMNSFLRSHLTGFSTKVAEGSSHRGLGLAIVSRLVKQSGGSITCYNKQGAVFVVQIPTKK